MKIFDGTRHAIDMYEVFVNKDSWCPDSVGFFADVIIKKLNLKEADDIFITFYGTHFLCPKAIVANAMEREKALSSHSKHYRTGNMYAPTVIRLSQCLNITTSTHCSLVHKSLDH